MPDYTVQSHIDSFLKTSTLNDARTNLGIDINVNSVVHTNSASWTTASQGSIDQLYSVVNSFSSQWGGYAKLNSIPTTYNILSSDIGSTITYTGYQNITAYITSPINTTGFITSIAQLSSGTVTISLSSSYTAGNLISYGSLYTTAGKGAIASLIRTSDNNFLLAGLLQ
jgi:hypothetical protein